MRRFEYSLGTSNKFWSIEISGKSFTVNFGRIGTAGQKQTKTFVDEAQAKKAYDKLIAEKLGKGYQETRCIPIPVGATREEIAWLTGKKPESMLTHLKTASVRKARLFAIACCRRIWHLLTDEDCREAVLLAERMAEGEATLEESARMKERLEQDFAKHNSSGAPNDPKKGVLIWSLWAARKVVADAELLNTDRPSDSSFGVIGTHDSCLSTLTHACIKSYADPPPLARMEQEEQAQADLLRDVLGNPFRPVVVDPRWRTPDVLKLASAAYAEREFERLPILGDALEDAGCGPTTSGKDPFFGFANEMIDHKVEMVAPLETGNLPAGAGALPQDLEGVFDLLARAQFVQHVGQKLLDQFLNQLLRQHLEDGGDGHRLIDARADIAETEFQSRTLPVGPGVPPQFGAVGNAVGLHQRVHQVGQLHPRGNRRRNSRPGVLAESDLRHVVEQTRVGGGAEFACS